MYVFKLHPKQRKMLTDIMNNKQMFNYILIEGLWVEEAFISFVNIILFNKDVNEYFRTYDDPQSEVYARTYLNQIRNSYIEYNKK